MKDKTVVYISILNGILIVINPIIGSLLLIEVPSSVLIIAAYSSVYAGISLIIGVILVKENYSKIGIDYLRLGIIFLWIALVIDIVALVIFNILLFTNIVNPVVLSIFELLIYNLIEVITILITIIIIKNFKKALNTHSHGKQFIH
jgi:hypothetical protein